MSETQAVNVRLRPYLKPVVPDAWIEDWREEGRRDILRQIDCIGYVESRDDSDACFYCEAIVSKTGAVTHKPDCLWLQAQAVKAE